MHESQKRSPPPSLGTDKARSMNCSLAITPSQCDRGAMQPSQHVDWLRWATVWAESSLHEQNPPLAARFGDEDNLFRSIVVDHILQPMDRKQLPINGNFLLINRQGNIAHLTCQTGEDDFQGLGFEKAHFPYDLSKSDRLKATFFTLFIEAAHCLACEKIPERSSSCSHCSGNRPSDWC